MIAERSAPLLVACPDVRAYQGVIDRLGPSLREGTLAPVLSPGQLRLSGFPPETRVVPYPEFLDGEATRHSGLDDRASLVSDSSPGRYCVSAPDDTCAAVARFLSTATGKDLALCTSLRDWERTIRELATSPSVASLTLLAPSWASGSGQSDATWMTRILELMRAMHTDVAGLSWGIITGADATTLSLLAAKAVLQSRIVEAYRDAPSGVVTERKLKSSIPRFRRVDDTAPLQLIDRLAIEDGTAFGVVQRPWSALVFKVHGRSYCACDGFLCGARPLDRDAAQPPKTCVLNMQCFSSTFPQFDPRSYDASVMVLDGCGTGNLGSRVWETGLPSLAFFALAGAPGAVVTGDGVTMNPVDDHVDVLWALASTATMGRATARLNRIRGEMNIHLPYYLLGDPDIPAGSARWPAWAVSASKNESLETPDKRSSSRRFEIPASDAPFVRFDLPLEPPPPNAQRSAAFLNLEPAIPAFECCAYWDGEDAEAWLGLPGNREDGVVCSVAHRPLPVLPRGLVAAARRLPQEVSSWRPPLHRSISRVLAAADGVATVDQMLQDMERQAVLADPETLQASAEFAVAELMAAQLECVERVHEISEEALWPFRLWNASRFHAEILDTPCPYCGLAPTVQRSYETTPGSTRQWRECARCELFQDRPVATGYPELRLRIPEPITAQNSAVAKLELDHSSGEIECVGAGTVVVDREGHGVSSAPRSFPLRVRAGQRETVEVNLTQTGPSSASHLYRARAILLLNGRWFWASLTLIAGGRTSKA